MKKLISRGLAMFLALVASLATFAGEQIFFDGGIEEGWPNSPTNGIWISAYDAVVDIAEFNTDYDDGDCVSLATGDNVLSFSPDIGKSAEDGVVSVKSRVRYSAFISDDMPEEIDISNGGLALVDEEEGLAFYGIVLVEGKNEWVKLPELSGEAKDNVYLDTAISLIMIEGEVHVRYSVGESFTDWLPINSGSDGIGKVSYIGEGAVTSLQGVFEEGVYEASIDDVKYIYFSDAYAAAKDGDIVKLLTDVSQFTIPSEIRIKQVYIDDNGFSLSVSPDVSRLTKKGLKLVNGGGLFGIALPFASGSGVKGDPYLISNATELELFQNGVNSETYAYGGSGKYNCFKVVDDIKVDSAWVGIGAGEKGFYGSFDGNGKRITITMANAVDNVNRGFFNSVIGTVANRACVSNLTVSVNGWNTTPSGSWGYAAIVGIAENAVFDNCVAEGGAVASALGNAAGICIRAKAGVEFYNCENRLDIKGNGDAVGGIVAVCEEGRQIIGDCRNAGRLSGGVATKVGQLIGIGRASALVGDGGNNRVKKQLRQHWRWDDAKGQEILED